MLVLLNPNAGGGTAAERWRRIEPQIRSLVGPYTLVEAANVDEVKGCVREALQAGETAFIAAGGDGTVNLVMTSLLENAPRRALERVTLGAVGLGSSNDYHKPLDPAKQIDGVPFKLDFVTTIAHDVCLLTYRDVQQALHTRRWLINASVGTTAEANRFFNAPDATLRWMKRVVPSLAMVYAALRTVFGYRSRPMTITLDETQTVYARVKNLGVVKNPHFTGTLKYNSPYEPGSGHFYVHLLKRVSLPRLIWTLAGLLFGRFSGHRTGSWRATRLRIEAEQPLAVLGDGEVVTAIRAYFSVVPDLLRVCT